MKLQHLNNPSGLFGPALLACAALFLAGCADSNGSSNGSSSGSSGSSSGGGSCKPGTSGCTTIVECPTGTIFKPFVNASATDTTFTATAAKNGICLGCSVVNPGNPVDPSTSDPATISIPVGLINGDTSLTVKDTVTTYPAGDKVGFIVSVPGAALLNLAALQPVTVTAINNGVDGTSAGVTRPLALDLLSLLANEGQTVATVISAAPFNAVRIDVAGVANVLTNVDVYAAGACVTP